MRSMEERRMDGVKILLEKRPGADNFSREIEATSPEALLNGLCMMIVLCARLTGLHEKELLAVIAAQLFAEEAEDAV